MKRIVKIFFVGILCLLFSVLCTAAEYKYEICPGQNISVEISNGKSELIRFCPAVSGVYRIESKTYYDLKAYVFNEDMTELAFNDDGGDTSNFAVEMQFEKNINYYFLVEAFVTDVIYANISATLVRADSSHIHTYENVSVSYPTCTVKGERTFKCICGDTYVIIDEPLEHDYTSEIVLPTCTAKGQEQYVCKNCKEVKTVEILPYGHQYKQSYTIDTPPTCTAKGSKSLHCVRCSSRSNVTSVAALGHSFESKFRTDIQATCTAKGSKSKHCSRCDKKSEITDIPAKGHSYSSKYTVDRKSTLSASGSKSRHCGRCSVKTDAVTIPKIMSVSLSKTQYVYNGENKKPSVTVKDSKGKALKSGTDYSVLYPKSMKSIGSHSVVVTFKGNYSGKKTLTYKILPGNVPSLTAKTGSTSAALSWKAVKGASKYRVYKYNETTKVYTKLCDVTKTTATIKNLKTGTYYIFVVRALKTVDSKDYLSAQYTAVKTATIPDKTVLSAKPDGRQAALSWKKVNSSGYEIFMSQSKNGSYSKVKTIKGGNVGSYTKSNLASGKTYYFKIRAYRKVGDLVVYGPYSNVVSVRIK